LKKSSGAVVGVAEVGRVWGFEIGAEKSLGEIREEFAERVCAELAFWEGCARARYATMIEIVQVGEVGEIRCEKKDRRAWVVLRRGKGA
ncbi:MAG TPA: hypothetical protein VFE58_04855, partial [Tepidisphaeraceae bacterium]|jgi:hypothetical protein|nr:hypothetical protein [Tepidisphaeraceae bacterium]